jgi:hypothetical protein
VRAKRIPRDQEATLHELLASFEGSVLVLDRNDVVVELDLEH